MIVALQICLVSFCCKSVTKLHSQHLSLLNSLLVVSSPPVKKQPLFNPIKATSIRPIVKHNHKVNVYLLSATLNSSNETAGGVSPHSLNSGRKQPILLRLGLRWM